MSNKRSAVQFEDSADSAPPAANNKKPKKHDDNDSNHNNTAYDLYMEGRTHSGNCTEEKARLALKDVKDVCWMHPFDWTKCAYILYNDGTVKEWVNDPGRPKRSWTSVTHYRRIISSTSFLENVSQITCGSDHAAAVLRDGSVVTWGKKSRRARYGRTLTSANDSFVLPGKVQNLGSLLIRQVACTEDLTLALDKDGKLLVWGSFKRGWSSSSSWASAIPTLIPNLPAAKQISARSGFIGVLTKDGKVYTLNLSSSCARKFPPTPSLVQGPLTQQSVAQISCGNYGCMGAVTTNGDLYTWFCESPGREDYLCVDLLGRGSPLDNSQAFLLVPSIVSMPNDEKVCSISMGKYHCAAISANGRSLFTWGLDAVREANIDSIDNGLQSYKRLGLFLTSLPKQVALPISSGTIKKVNCGEYFTAILAQPDPGKSFYDSVAEVAELFNDHASADIEFTLEGKTICYAHKHILCECSAYFVTLFRRTKTSTFEIEAPPDIFLALMRYIYGVPLNIDEPKMMPLLFQAADFYGLGGVIDWCCDELGHQLTLENVGSILQDAFNRGQDDLQELCIEFILKKQSDWTKNRKYTEQVESKELLLKMFEQAAQKIPT